MVNLFRSLLSSSVASHYGKGNPDQAMECERVAVDFVIAVGLLLKVDTFGSFRRSYRLSTLSPLASRRGGCVVSSIRKGQPES